ncbi:hypothetical protein [Pleomorphomonas koreensis]|uniref:hypothetical protein n=1 Tax=Pleomorphomonas koreensis TaxID=257440 RepID=UPI00069EF64F|nr:hypothetical protein [Pleomorphomonas koreensis]
MINRAVVNSRLPSSGDLEFWPTPPWATRALCAFLKQRGLAHSSCWEPCCGEGHMVHALNDYFQHVTGSDVFDYGKGFPVVDALDPAVEVPAVDWVITNPAFTLAEQLAKKVLDAPTRPSLALLNRSNWSEGGTRYYEIFEKRRPTWTIQFSERVPMIQGAWDPEASSATAYAWFVWVAPPFDQTIHEWFPPTQETQFTRLSDRAFAMPGEAARRRAAKAAEGAESRPADLFEERADG